MRIALTVVLAIVLTVGGACSDGCALDDVIAIRFDGASYVDCGQFAMIDDAAYAAAHDCVTAELAAGDAFAVVWAKIGTDSQIDGAYLRVPGESGLELEQLYADSDPSGGSMSGGVVLVSRCERLDDLGAACLPYELETQLCFECAGEVGLEHCPPL